jgi:phosphoribosylanthranilate isomerase
LDQDGIIEILNQSKPPEWHEAMVNANIDIFQCYHDESDSYFKHLEKFENIRSTNGIATVPVENKKSVTSSADKSSENPNSSNMWRQ